MLLRNRVAFEFGMLDVCPFSGHAVGSQVFLTLGEG